eukprot:1562421-Pleurochrysis_carterae.AAC.5
MNPAWSRCMQPVSPLLGLWIVPALVCGSQECFDDLLIPEDHPGRLPSDTYYISRKGHARRPI